MNYTPLETPELLFAAAETMNVQPAWLIPRQVFSITIDDTEHYINFARSPLNSDLSVSLAKNKYLTRRIFDRHGFENIPYCLLDTQAEAALFLDLHGTIIVKPVDGAGASDIHIVTDRAELTKFTAGDYLLEKYIAGQELRYVVLNDEVIAVHRSDYGTSVAKDRLLERISYPESDWDQVLIRRSREVADVLDLKFATIDFMIDTTGRASILEVNTMPGLKYFHAPTRGPVVDIARFFLESTIENIRQETYRKSRLFGN